MIRPDATIPGMAVASPERLRDDMVRLLAPDNAGVRRWPGERWLTALGKDGRPGRFRRRWSRWRAARAPSPAGGLPAPARARVRTASGRWLVVRASTLGGDAPAETAVIVEPASPHELAPLIADAYDLTERERAVTQLVARGLNTNAIARRLHISPGPSRTTSRRSSRRSA